MCIYQLVNPLSLIELLDAEQSWQGVIQNQQRISVEKRLKEN